MIFLLDSSIKITIVLLLALGAGRLLRRQSAAVRHWVLAMSLAMAALVPVFSFVIPAWSINPYMSRPLPVETAAVVEAEAVAPTAVMVTAPVPVSRRIEPGMVLVAGWGIGVIAAFMVIVVGTLWLAWIAARSRDFKEERWGRIAAELSHRYGFRRPVRLLQSRREAMLATWGVLRPRLLLPAGAESWTDDRIRAVLSHELAHISRFDWLTQIASELLRAVYWFHPLVWIVNSRIKQESEHACDDAALNLGLSGTEYAAHLLDVARTLKPSERGWSSALAMARPSTLERRFSAMLNPVLNRGAVTRRMVLASMAVALAITMSLAGLTASPAEAPPLPPMVQPQSQPPVPVEAPVPPPRLAIEESPRPGAPFQIRVARPVTEQAPTNTSRPNGVVRVGGGVTEQAAPNTSRLTGVVRDGAGTAVPRATVIVSFPDGRTRGIATTSVNVGGTFVIGGLEPGNYVLQVFAAGFGPSRIIPIEVKAGENLQQDVTMDIGFVPPPTPEEVAAIKAREAQMVTRIMGIPPPPPPSPTGYQRIGGSVASANLLHRVEPNYPPLARQARVSGIVILEVSIRADGFVERIRVISGHPLLAPAAVEAVQQWQYKPVQLNGEDVSVVTTVTVNFSLPD